MLEKLEYVRRDFKVATKAFSEELGTYVEMEQNVADTMFKDFVELRQEIIACNQELKHNYLKIGSCLSTIRNNQLYRAVQDDVNGSLGFTNFYNFCEVVFGYRKTWTKNVLSVYDHFVDKDKQELDVMTDRYSYSQLVEMSYMRDGMNLITTSMPCRDIRLVKRYFDSHSTNQFGDVQDIIKHQKEFENEEKRLKNNAKTRLNFIGASEGRTSDLQSTDTKNVQGRTSDLPSDELLSTPDTKNDISLDTTLQGLKFLLTKLERFDGWEKLCDLLNDVIKFKTPNLVCSSRDLIEENKRFAKCNTLLINKSTDFCKVNVSRSGKLNLKNDTDRKKFIDGFCNWGVWREFPELNKKYYRYDFINDCSLIVEVSTTYYDYGLGNSEGRKIVYSIITPERPKFNADGVGGVFGVMKWLTEHRNEI